MPTPVIIAGDVIVGEFASDAGAAAAAGRLQGLRQPEVQHLDSAVVAHLDVRRLEIAMDDALLVRRLERLGDLVGDWQRLVERNRATRDALRQIVALDQFHHERAVTPPALLQAVDCSDVRMVQRGEDFRFALEARKPLGVTSDRRRQDLDRDLALQLRVGRPIHLAHAAGADRGGDFVGTEACAGDQGQTDVDYTGGTVPRPELLLCSGGPPSGVTPRGGERLETGKDVGAGRDRMFRVDIAAERTHFRRRSYERDCGRHARAPQKLSFLKC